MNQRVETAAELKRDDDLMQAVVALVVDKYGGSLKAEHGTGRNMAPFVEKEWGMQAYEVMKRIKALFDPEVRLNPGVIFNDDHESHLKNIKPLPRTHELIDRCIECGFCEVNCLSCGYTLSARQRLVVLRQISMWRSSCTRLREELHLEHAFL